MLFPPNYEVIWLRLGLIGIPASAAALAKNLNEFNSKEAKMKRVISRLLLNFYGAYGAAFCRRFNIV